MVDMQGTSDNLQLKKDYKFNQINKTLRKYLYKNE